MQSKILISSNLKISVIGLGYIGLPLAIEFSKKFNVIGYDINFKRIQQLNKGFDKSSGIKLKYKKENKIKFTSNNKYLQNSDIFIITVPTPIHKNKKPNLSFLRRATVLVGNFIKDQSIIIYESTVYPGTTEEYCAPILEKVSGLKYINSSKNIKKNINGFYCGYSPERINPGDNKHNIKNICKITSGSTPKISNFINELYKKIINVGTYKVKSIKIAEAAKIIENAQRDINIALINELSIIFHKMDIDTHLVLKAAKTKWNFFPFYPGLVGGHCIGVDPYYLTYKAKQFGYEPQVLLSGRKINDKMGFYVSEILIKKMRLNKIKIKNSKVLIMGLTFKENCSDIRNTRIIDIIKKLKIYGLKTEIYDPLVESKIAFEEYNIKLIKNLKNKSYDSVIIAVAHSIFRKMGINKIRKLCKKKNVIFDVKNIFPLDEQSIKL